LRMMLKGRLNQHNVSARAKGHQKDINQRDADQLVAVQNNIRRRQAARVGAG
jgi:hypothetical protein